MNAFKYHRFIMYAGLLKTSVFAFFAALTPWALAYVFLPTNYQTYHPWIYLICSVLFMLGFVRIYVLRTQDRNQAIKSAKTFFNAKNHSKHPVPQSAEKQILTTGIETQQAEEMLLDENELDQHQKQKNILQTLDLLKAIQAIIDDQGFAVTTDDNSSLNQIAQEYQNAPPTEMEAICLLLSQYQATLWIEIDDLENCHAQIMLLLIQATGQSLDITAVKSLKDEHNHQCVVTFQSDERNKRWKFIEPNHFVAENFLRHAINFIGHKAKGRFIFNHSEDAMLCYTFIPNQLLHAFSKVFDIKENR